MRIKKFTGHTFKDAAEAMKRELGPEAIVIHTHTRNSGGALGLFGKRIIEITGAVDDVQMDNRESERTSANIQASTYSLQSLSRKKRAERPNEAKRNSAADGEQAGANIALALRRRGANQGETDYRSTTANRVEELAVLHQVQDEVQSVKGILQTLQHDVRRIKIPTLPKILQQAYTQLCAGEVEEPLACTLVHSVFEELSPEHHLREDVVEQQLLQRIESMLRIEQSPPLRQQGPRVIALIGPTGVGKTTSIAKLASINKLLAHKHVALVSADTYRIGALDQLRTFAAIAQIPLEVTYEPSDVSSALSKFQEYDMIFLDTVGRSQRNEHDLAELSAILKAANADEVHLTLTPSTSFSTLVEIAERFGSLNPNRLLFTKIDEARAHGSILNLVHRMRLPVSYLTNGQTVPDDLMVAEPSHLASLIYHGADLHA